MGVVLDLKNNYFNLPSKQGVYCIVNIINNKKYIGSSKNIRNRIMCHFSQLRNNSHYNKRLQNSFNKYKINNFYFCILEFVDNNLDLLNIEKKYIDIFNSTNDKIGYNINGETGNIYGHRVSDNNKKKISKFFKKRNESGLNHWIGRKHSVDSISKMKKTLSDGRRKGKNNSQFGKPGRYKGKKRPESHLVKIREAAKKRHTIKSFKCNEINKIFCRTSDVLYYLNIKDKHGGSAILKCLDKKQKTYKKYTFSYLDCDLEST